MALVPLNDLTTIDLQAQHRAKVRIALDDLQVIRDDDEPQPRQPLRLPPTPTATPYPVKNPRLGIRIIEELKKLNTSPVGYLAGATPEQLRELQQEPITPMEPLSGYERVARPVRALGQFGILPAGGIQAAGKGVVKGVPILRPVGIAEAGGEIARPAGKAAAKTTPAEIIPPQSLKVDEIGKQVADWPRLIEKNHGDLVGGLAATYTAGGLRRVLELSPQTSLAPFIERGLISRVPSGQDFAGNYFFTVRDTIIRAERAAGQGALIPPGAAKAATDIIPPQSVVSKEIRAMLTAEDIIPPGGEVSGEMRELIYGKSSRKFLVRLKEPLTSTLETADDGAIHSMPPPVNPFEFRSVPVTLSTHATLRNLGRDAVSRVGIKRTKEAPLAETAFKQYAQENAVVQSTARAIGIEFGERIRKTFKLDRAGRIAALEGADSLVGKPELADIAAKLPRYLDKLSPPQVQLLEDIRTTLAPYDEFFRALGGKRGTRPDVMEGGFYIPRGGAELADIADEAEQLIMATKAGAIKGVGKVEPAKFGSQAAGVAAGYKYMTPGEAIEDYINKLGRRTVEMRTADFFKSAAVAKGHGTGAIEFPGLRGESFPIALANSATAMMESMGPKSGILFIKGVKPLNDMLLNLNSTGDNSAMTIQALLGMWRDPVAYTRALGVSLLAWANPHVLATKFLSFNEKIAKTGGLTVTEWAKEGLTITGTTAQEFTGGIVSKVPLIKQANRAFVDLATSLALDRSNGQLQTLLRQGQTIADLRASGTTREIAEAMNRSVGRVRGRAGGSLGESLLFSSRFLQSQIETVYRGGKGLIPGVGKMGDRIATRDILQLIAGGTALTYLANAAQGMDTDFRPIINGRRNPNFLTVRIGNKDYSLFGPYASLVGLTIDLGTGHPMRALESKSSPLVSKVWSMIAGQDYVGTPTRENAGDIAEWMLTAFSPIGVKTIAKELPKDVGIAEQAATVAAAHVGLRATALSTTDIRQQVGAELVASGTVPPFDPDNIPLGISRLIEQDPRVQARRAQSDVRATELPTVSQAKLLLDTRGEELESGLRHMMRIRTGKDLREDVDEFILRYSEASATVFGALPEKDRPLMDTWANKYYAVPLSYSEDGEPNYKLMDTKKADILRQAVEAGVPEKYITGRDPGDYRGLRYADPAVRDQVNEILDVRDTLRPYWDIAEKELKNVPEDLATYNAWKNASTADRKSMLIADRSIKWLIKDMKIARWQLRHDDPAIEAALVKWYEYKPVDWKRPR